MRKLLLMLILFFAFIIQAFGQGIALSFQEAEQKGISIKHLDSVYKSALHIDTSLAVFKTEKEQEMVKKAYITLFKDFGKFLKTHNFKWDKPTRCFNKIYFNTDGHIDYFLFNFLGKTVEDKPTEEKQKEFQYLLNLFIKDYKFPLTTKTKFAQCSPTIYTPD